MVDTHCHLHFSEFDHDRDDVLSRARQGGVQTVILVGCDDKDSEQARGLAYKIPEAFFAVGFHPHQANQFGGRQEEKLSKLVRDPKCVAVGEIGLDYYRNLSPREDQKRVFIAMLELAKRNRLPLIIHSREASKEMIQVLKKHAPFADSGVMHCFAGDEEYLTHCLELGFYISFAGNVTFANAPQLRERAAEVPLDRLLGESDCPYLTPVPFRGKRNEPRFLEQTIRKLAELRNLPFAEMDVVLSQNARRLFKLDDHEKN